MDTHILDAFIDCLTDRVAQRLGLRPPAKAIERHALAPLQPVRAAEPSPAAPASNALQEYLTPRQLAEVLGVTEEGLQKMRSQGRGPKFVKVGGRIRYRRSDLP